MQALGGALRGAVRRAVAQQPRTPPRWCAAAATATATANSNSTSLYRSRGFSSSTDDATSVDTAGMSLSWEELSRILSMASEDNPSSADASTRASLWSRVVKSHTPLRQDEWTHPSGVATFWLLRPSRRLCRGPAGKG